MKWPLQGHHGGRKQECSVAYDALWEDMYFDCVAGFHIAALRICWMLAGLDAGDLHSACCSAARKGCDWSRSLFCSVSMIYTTAHKIKMFAKTKEITILHDISLQESKD